MRGPRTSRPLHHTGSFVLDRFSIALGLEPGSSGAEIAKSHIHPQKRWTSVHIPTIIAPPLLRVPGQVHAAVGAAADQFAPSPAAGGLARPPGGLHSAARAGGGAVVADRCVHRGGSVCTRRVPPLRPRPPPPPPPPPPSLEAGAERGRRSFEVRGHFSPFSVSEGPFRAPGP